MGRVLAATFVALSLAIILASISYCVLLGVSILGTLARSSWSSGRGSSLSNWLDGLSAVVAILIVVLVVVLSQTRRPRGTAGDSRFGPVGSKWDSWKSGRIAVVLTAYDDQDAIGLAVTDFRVTPRLDRIIVVDNNSRDRTAEVARDAGATVVRENSQGYGFACMRVLREALSPPTAEVIVLAEGDMTFFGEDVEKLLPYLANCDMVVGTRTTRALTREGSQMDWFMIWGNLYLALLVRLRFWDNRFAGEVQLTDVGCTFRAIRRPALEMLLPRLSAGGHDFSPHMILRALESGLRVLEVPIQFRSRVGVSKGAGGNRTRAIAIGLSMIKGVLSD